MSDFFLFLFQADILQLDVVWLFDDFEGGGDPPVGGDYSVGSGGSSSSRGKQTVPEIISSSIADTHIGISNNIGHIDGVSVIEKDESSTMNEVAIPSYSWADLKNMKRIRQKASPIN